MSDAYMCDRCNELETGTPYGYINLTMANTDTSKDDLCESCYKELEKEANLA